MKMKRKWIGISLMFSIFFFACNPEGKLPQPDIKDIFPTISPDNKHIVFTRHHTNTSEPGIYIMDIDGENLQKIYGNPLYTTYMPALTASWSPDSKKIAIVTENKLLLIVDKKGKVLDSLQLINENQHTSLAQWSTDGKTITCTYIMNDNTLPVINLIEMNSKQQRQINIGDIAIQGKISISNDNSKLLYGNKDSIFISDTVGNLLFKFKTKGYLNRSYFWVNTPVWGNDENKIYYRDVKSMIYAINTKENTESLFIENAAMPSFSLDGNFVVFVRPDNHNVHEKIWIKNLLTNIERELKY